MAGRPAAQPAKLVGALSILVLLRQLTTTTLAAGGSGANSVEICCTANCAFGISRRIFPVAESPNVTAVAAQQTSLSAAATFAIGTKFDVALCKSFSRQFKFN